jgi:hypothetical protein
LVAVSAAALVTGCAIDDTMTSIAMSTTRTPSAGVDAQSAPQLALPSLAGGQPDAMTVTSQQREYLDALEAVGVQPSNDLVALSIGSYVCQARAAKQSDQALWDVVLPLVRGDVRAADARSSPPSAAAVDTATADYIRIATDRLC